MNKACLERHGTSVRVALGVFISTDSWVALAANGYSTMFAEFGFVCSRRGLGCYHDLGAF